MQTVSPRRAKTRQKLMASAVEVIAERGFPSASVEEICERAGFTRGAFYSNFDSKEALALAMVRAQAEEQLAGARAAIESALTDAAADDSVEGLIARAIRTFERTQPSDRDALLLHAELQLHAIRNPDFGRAFAGFESDMTALFEETIAGSLHSRGLRLAVPTAQAIELLAAVHQHSGLNRLLPTACDRGSSLERLMLALIRRV